MKAVNVHSASGPRASNKRADDALRIAAHLSALERWIEMLRARGVNRNDDGLVALARRRQTLEQEQLRDEGTD